MTAGPNQLFRNRQPRFARRKLFSTEYNQVGVDKPMIEIYTTSRQQSTPLEKFFAICSTENNFSAA